MIIQIQIKTFPEQYLTKRYLYTILFIDSVTERESKQQYDTKVTPNTSTYSKPRS